jgi:adenine phosphoribosyltransferase
MKPKTLSLRDVENFPKKGILFKDISPLLSNPKEMKQLISYLADYWKGKVDKIGGFDARGFIFGSLLAYEMGLPFFMLRKKGKLPGECREVSYDLEYGSASLEMQTDAVKPGEKVLLVDDLLATGGTALAGCQLVEQVGGVIVGCQFIIDLAELPGKEKLSGYNIQSVITC